jgi:hypothetical protein
MNARGTFSLVAFVAVLLCGVLLATAAAPNIGQNQLPAAPAAATVQISALVGVTVLDSQGQKLGQIKSVLLDSRTGQATSVVLDTATPAASQATTYSAARPIDNAVPPAPPSLPAPLTSPAPVLMPPPCFNSVDSGLPQNLTDFYDE